LITAGRDGDGTRAARYAGQLDIIDVLMQLPQNELKRMG